MGPSRTDRLARFAFAGHLGEGIALAHHDLLHAPRDEQVGARWGSAVVGTRLQVHVQDGIIGNRPIAKGA